MLRTFRELKRRWVWAIAVFAAAAVIVAYFTAPAGLPARSEPVEIAATVYPGSAPIYVAKERGFFRAEGIQVTIRGFSSGRACLEAVLDDRAQLATVAEIPTALAAMGGAPIALVATIFSGERDHAVVARRDRGINQPTDLAGSRVAVTPGTTSAFLMDLVLDSAALSRADVQWVELKPEAMGPAISSGKVDAVSTWHPYLRDIQEQLGARGLTFDAFDVQGLFSLTINLVVKRDLLERKGASLRAVLRALVRANEFIESHPDEARRITAQYTGLDETLLRELWGGYRFELRLDQSLQIALEDVSRWAIEHRMTAASEVPNFQRILAPAPLVDVRPQAISIIR